MQAKNFNEIKKVVATIMTWPQEKMQQVLSEAMNIPVDDISIKATTNEKLGYVGKEEGANAYAVALITR